MNFFGREKEIEILRRERELSLENSRFTVVSGRRRIEMGARRSEWAYW